MTDEHTRAKLKQLVDTAKTKLNISIATPSSEIMVTWGFPAKVGSNEKIVFDTTNLTMSYTATLVDGYTSCSATREEARALILDGAWQRKPPRRVP